MNLLDEIEALSEGVGSVELSSLFEKALNTEDKDDAFDAFDALSDKQWHTYEKLKLDLFKKLENWLLENWDRSSIDDAERLTSIVPRLGLESVFCIMKEELLNLPRGPRDEFQSFFDEVGESVADPYDGMR